ncbi:MAG TPA: rhomboid family intramembrane serine protease [Sediminibacterium sp.]|uniref:rhomboid family intramembrane serine protease n=1 Tax=Sediminibacterium sp. TaxID=1917865 RepID=UPI00267A5D39|nr:rhomboid family intramembrane serine protease [Sediminibacterium sp.]HQS23281.1 rhomboid family intramembrane serine protease [Sediminibacterium sp.]HQS36051.1 rhomboid family intramembrane serine protease [Sediminibacterium sp.]
MITLTISIILLTSLISFTAFSNQKVLDDLIFYPPAITNRNQWYRFITSGLIHADIMHLVFNMYSFYLFGDLVEKTFVQIFGESGKVIYIVLYVVSLIVCLLPTYFNNQNNYHYRSLGASGAVSAVIFAGIFLYPTMGMGIFPIPFHIPGFIFGPLYLILSAYLAKKGHGNINHSAHIWGAIFGIVFVVITTSFMTKFNAIENFLNAIQLYLGSF